MILYDLENSSEIITEEFTNESTEAVTEDSTEIVTEVSTEVVTEVSTEELDLIYNDPDNLTDTHLYLSCPVENATLNDIFSIGLSIRNILLLFLLLWVVLNLFKMLKNAVYKLMNR